MRRAAARWALAAFALAACQSAEPPADGAAPTAVDSAVVGAVPSVADSTADGAAPAAAADSAPSGVTALTADGWGPLRIGMTREAVVAAAGEDANPEAVGGPEPEQCDLFRPTRAPEGMIVMIEQGRLTRITLVDGASVETDRGFGVGDPASAIRAAYGAEATTSPHKYVAAPAEYITTWATAPPAAEPRGIRYEIGADGRVTHVHAGGPSIEYVEGCL